MFSRRSFLKRASCAVAALPVLGAAADKAGAAVTANIPSADDPLFWAKLRGEFVFPETETYFNNGTLGAQPRYVLDSVIEHMKKSAAGIAEWDFSGDDSKALISGYYPYNSIRSKIARFINAQMEEISLTQNATMGMNYLANGIDLEPGDEVLSTDQEHPGGRCGFLLKEKRYKTVWKEVKIPKPVNDPNEIIRLFIEAITPKTKVIAFSHISTVPGVVFPAKELLRSGKRKRDYNFC